MEHDSSRSGYHEPEPGLAGREDEEDWGDDFPKTFSVNLIWAQACDKEGHDGAIGFEAACHGICLRYEAFHGADRLPSGYHGPQDVGVAKPEVPSAAQPRQHRHLA